MRDLESLLAQVEAERALREDDLIELAAHARRMQAALKYIAAKTCQECNKAETARDYLVGVSTEWAEKK